MKKILIIGLITCSLLITSTYSVVAAEEEKTFEDPSGDVIDVLSEEYTTNKPDVDIINITYSKTGKDVTLSLKVKGKIEDRGDIDDPEAETLVSYGILLSTDKQDYNILYVNQECLLNEVESGITFDKDESTITFYFDLESDDENYVGLYVVADDIVMTGFYDIQWYEDDFSDEAIGVSVDAGGSYEGVVNQSVNFSGSASGGSPPYMWEWNFGDGNISNEQNPTHIYSEAKEYSVVLRVTDANEDSYYDYATVIISDGGDDGDNGDDGGSGDSTDGTSDNNGDSSDFGLLIFGAVIVIIAIIGVIVIIAIIRR